MVGLGVGGLGEISFLPTRANWCQADLAHGRTGQNGCVVLGIGPPFPLNQHTHTQSVPAKITHFILLSTLGVFGKGVAPPVDIKDHNVCPSTFGLNNQAAKLVKELFEQ